MRTWILGSGSGGNAVLVEAGEGRVLVDAGFGVRTLALRLMQIGIPPQSIEACIITHEHGDHVKGAAAAARRWGWALHATRGTVAHAPELAGVTVHPFAAGATLAFSSMDVATARTPHDAAEPVGVVLTARATGARTTVCTDIGHVSDGVRALCRDVDILVLESNHDEQMLRAGPYPAVVQERIAGERGHLANRHAAALIRDSATRRLRHVVLAHLSEKCNAPELAREATEREVKRTVYRGVVTTARQRDVVGPFDACDAGRVSQLGLAL
ncbi:MAG TPA: MBL fold metallo-hydrolase [Gemmatimonadaceae bacterium]|nr:MBL fold metallo-hydrolase [Gemmatimonadaceae bacterium]